MLLLNRRSKFLDLLAPLALIGAVCLTAVSARSQTVVFLELRNGDQLSGVILQETTNHVVLSNAWSKEVSVPVDQIAVRTLLPAMPLAGVGVPPAPPAAPPAAVEAPAPPRKAEPPSVATDVTAKPVEPKKPKRWSGEVEVGMDVLQSSKTRQIYHGRAKATYIKDRFRNTSEISGAYGRTEGIVDANRVNSENKTDFDVGERTYVYNLVGVGYDKVRKIDLRYEAGPGVGYHAFKQPTFVLNLEAGFNFQAEERSAGNNVERVYARLGENGSWKINSKLSFEHRFEYMPSIREPSEYRLRAEATLRYLLWQNLSFKLSVVDNYDTSPARNVTPNDLQIRSSLGYKF